MLIAVRRKSRCVSPVGFEMSVCPVCGSQDRPYLNERILAKYDVTYFFCDNCGFLHTEKPYWLEEAYSDAIVATDTGIVRRNLDASGKAAALFTWMFARKGKYLDMAGGYGLFTRLMRDMGFDYYWSDPHASNFFARGFEAQIDSGSAFRGATAFEVLEHLEDPVGFIQSVFQKTKCEAFLFSTELYTGREPPLSWWYYSCHSGQHISFFHRKTLARIAEVLNVNLYSNGAFHLLSVKPVNRLIFFLLTSRASAKFSPLAFGVFARPKIANDHEMLLHKGPTK